MCPLLNSHRYILCRASHQLHFSNLCATNGPTRFPVPCCAARHIVPQIGFICCRFFHAVLDCGRGQTTSPSTTAAPLLVLSWMTSRDSAVHAEKSWSIIIIFIFFFPMIFPLPPYLWRLLAGCLVAYSHIIGSCSKVLLSRNMRERERQREEVERRTCTFRPRCFLGCKSGWERLIAETWKSLCLTCFIL